MQRIRIELIAIRAIIELAPESPPAVVETHSGAITLSERPGLAKTRPSNVVPFLRGVGGR